MINSNQTDFLKKPIHKLSGSNYFRFIAFTGLILISLFSFYLMNYVGFIIAILGLYCLSMIVFIKFPVLNVYDDHFEIIKKSLIVHFSDRAIYNFNDLKNIEFSKGYTNWIMTILVPLAFPKLSGYIKDEQYSKLDSMIITTLNNEKIEISRFGSRESFIKTIEIIKNKINPTTSTV